MTSSKLPLINKEHWIINKIRDSSVIHVGCTDWPLTQERIQQGSLLHSKICEVSGRCIGVDLDKAGIDKLKNLMPDQEFHACNAEQLDLVPGVAFQKWDFIVAGDVLEHMDNPGAFMAAASRLLTEQGKLIVTVPNAFSAKRFFWLFFTGTEHVHPDHTAYFSESTLTRIGARHGYKTTQINGFQWKNPSTKNRLANAVTVPLLWASHGRLADELAVEFQLAP